MIPEIFVSYSSLDRSRVTELIRPIASAGGRFWWDQQDIFGGDNYGPRIVEGIKTSKVLLLCCTAASMRSRNVKQEIQLAWKYEVPYLPLLLERISFDEQLQYWLEGWQWIEVLNRPVDCWLPQVLGALVARGVTLDRGTPGVACPDVRASPSAAASLDQLFAVARFTDQMWPVKATGVSPNRSTRSLRDLGAPQDDVLHRFPIGSRVQIRLEIEHDTSLLLLDRGPSGTLYCLCPSAFAPWPRLGEGRHVLPQPGARYTSFLVTGKPGREHLLAILSDAPLPFDWMPRDPRLPARSLDSADVEALIKILRTLPPESWAALSTYFETETV